MTRRSLLRCAPAVLAAATLLAACSELPSDAVTRNPLTPRATVTPTNAFFSIDGGQLHACGLTAAGQAWCWGRNAMGQLGDSSAANSSTPVATWQSGVTFTSITAGEAHTCGLTSLGQAWCWGANADGRLGDSTVATLPLVPVSVHQQSLAFTSISAGSLHTCALTSAGQAYCWGHNFNGQLGDNSKHFRATPTAVAQPGGVTFFQIQAGGTHTCALALGGQAYCWGYGGDGQLGYGATTGDSVPHAVSQGGLTFGSIYTEYSFTCGLTSGGYAYCWGRNDSGQLGDGTTTSPRTTPVASTMPSGVSYVDMALSGSSACGLDGTGQAYCWGSGSQGRLGNGGTSPSTTPVAVSQPVGVSFFLIRAETGGACGLDANWQTWCWGLNTWGQIGDGTTTNRTSPVAVLH